MVYSLICDCHERIETKINSCRQFEELKSFFSSQVERGVFKDVQVQKPYYSWRTFHYYADKWYKCKCCGCLWEFIYPDFPAYGMIRKFPDGKYKSERETR